MFRNDQEETNTTLIALNYGNFYDNFSILTLLKAAEIKKVEEAEEKSSPSKVDDPKPEISKTTAPETTSELVNHSVFAPKKTSKADIEVLKFRHFYFHYL